MLTLKEYEMALPQINSEAGSELWMRFSSMCCKGEPKELRTERLKKINKSFFQDEIIELKNLIIS
jgi:hypothetical protein